MNCIGPTARSHWVSPSKRPPSVSPIAAKPAPFSAGPRIGRNVVPPASTAPRRPGGLHLADRGEQLPGQVAAGGAQDQCGLGLAVGGEHRLRQGRPGAQRIGEGRGERRERRLGERQGAAAVDRRGAEGARERGGAGAERRGGAVGAEAREERGAAAGLVRDGLGRGGRGEPEAGHLGAGQRREGGEDRQHAGQPLAEPQPAAGRPTGPSLRPRGPAVASCGRAVPGHHALPLPVTVRSPGNGQTVTIVPSGA